MKILQPTTIAPVKRSVSTTFKPKQTSNSGKLECFAPFFDKNIGCGASDQKISCISQYLSQVMNCFFFGEGDAKYFLTRNDDLLNCEKRDGYTRHQMLDLMGCANSNGKVKNNTCTNEQGFCDCDRPIGKDKFGNTTTIHKKWSAAQQKCDCDQASAYPALSLDGQCCVPQNASCNEDHQFYDCVTGDCQCQYPYVKIDIEGHPENGQCFFACNAETQNNPRNVFDPDKGFAGCGAPGNGTLWGGRFYIGKSDDLCCGTRGTCTLDENPSSNKAQCLATDNLWIIDSTKALSCPRTGECQIPRCGYDEVGSYPTFGSSCNVDIRGMGILVPKANNRSCRSWCDSKCKSLGSNGDQLFIESYNVIGDTDCQCTCKETPPSAL